MNILDVAFGAQVLSVKRSSLPDLLYCSPFLAPAGQVVRGGVPVLFPQFANLGPLPKHGFVRTRPWRLLNRWHKTEQCGVLYELDLPLGAEPAWPHAVTLELEVQLTANTLLIVLRVTNKGKLPLPWTGGLHPYWRLSRLQDAQLMGLANEPKGLRFNAQGLEQLSSNHGPLNLITGTYAMQLQATGFAEWMLWNPGHVGAQMLTDLPPDDWQYFVCIEPVCVSEPKVLAQGEVFEGTLLAKWVDNRKTG